MLSFEDSAIIIYATVFSTAIFVALVWNFRSYLGLLAAALRQLFLQHVSYQPIFRSARLMNQWSRADILGLVIYFALNGFCISFRSSSVDEAGHRAAKLGIVNLLFLYATPHLDVLTNTLGMQWRTICRFHGAVGVLTALLLVFHTIAFALSRNAFPVARAENLWAIVAAASTIASVAICFPAFRNGWYEIFLRAHQSLAILSLYGIWVHIAPRDLLPRLLLYVVIGVAGLSTFFSGAIMAYRNGIFRCRLTRADILHAKGAVLVRVILARPVRVKAGQFISLWIAIPSTNFCSLWEYHPFVVANWSENALDTLDLLIEPRSGLTLNLLQRSQTRQDHCRALFSGPHGSSVPVGTYEIVLMAATGYGIAAQLPYLKQLLHDYNSRKAKARRIHLVWELKTLELPLAIESLLNNALIDDTLDDGYILQISVYVENVGREERISPRAEVIRGLPDWSAIIQEEAAGKYIKRVQDETSKRGDMIVTISTSPGVRRHLQAIVQKHVRERVELVELDYQPDH